MRVWCVLLQNWKCEVILLSIQLFITIANGELLTSTLLTLEEFRLVRCLTNISRRFFPPGRTLVISSPSTYRDVQLELIAEIHRTVIWPVVVTLDGNISIPKKTDFIDRDISYNILTRGGNFKSLTAKIIALGPGQYKFTRIWNSEVRFVFAVAND